MKQILLGIGLLAGALGLQAEDLVLWTGNHTASWGNSLMVSTVKAYGKTGTGDKVKVEYKLTAASGNIKVANMTPWITFDEQSGLKGNTYEYTLTEEAARTLIPGSIAFQGVGLDITKVSVTTDHGDKLFDDDLSDPEPRPQCVIFDIPTSYFYGVDYKKNSTTVLEFNKRGGLGWSRPEGVDLSGIKTIEVSMKKALANKMVLNICYGPKLQDVYSVALAKGKTSYTIDLKSSEAQKASDFKHVLYVGFLSDSMQETSIENLTFTAKDTKGNVWADAAGVEDIASEADAVSVKYYNLQGIEVAPGTKGLVIKRTVMSDGSVKTVKTIN